MGRSGGVKTGESLEDGAVRELREETGIRVDPKQLQKIQELPHGNTKTVVYAVLLDQALDYDRIFSRRKRGETTAYSYAVIPHWASTPHVLNRRRQLESVTWRRSVRSQFDFFPRVSKIEEWTQTLIGQNGHLSVNTSPEYVSHSRADSDSKQLLGYVGVQRMRETAEAWKDDGILERNRSTSTDHTWTKRDRLFVLFDFREN